MRFHVFNIPISAEGLGRGIEDANRFLDRVEVREVSASLVEDKVRGSIWSVLIAYEPRVSNFDGASGPSGHAAKRETASAHPATPGPVITAPALDEAGVALYEALRSWRNNEARRRDVPGYTIMTNRQLQKVAEVKPRKSKALEQVIGLSAKSVADFGDAVLALVRGEKPPETEEAPASQVSVKEEPSQPAPVEPQSAESAPEEPTSSQEPASEEPASEEPQPDESAPEEPAEKTDDETPPEPSTDS